MSAARAAASRNENARSAELFARAIALDRSGAWNCCANMPNSSPISGRAGEAVPLYREALASGKLIEGGEAAGPAWPGPRPAVERALLRGHQGLEADSCGPIPNDLDARKNVTEAFVGAARAGGLADRNAESANLFARAIALSPGRRLELGVEYANQLTYSGTAPTRRCPSTVRYSQPHAEPGGQRRSAMLGLALALDWSGQTSDSLDVYDEIVSAYPELREALVGRGNVLTQMDRNKEALADFERAMLLAPGST